MAYRIVETQSAGQMEQQVDKLSMEGWELYGHLQVVNKPYQRAEREFHQTIYIQTMILSGL